VKIKYPIMHVNRPTRVVSLGTAAVVAGSILAPVIDQQVFNHHVDAYMAGSIGLDAGGHDHDPVGRYNTDGLSRNYAALSSSSASSAFSEYGTLIFVPRLSRTT
jgi:hypothetical protein